MERYADGEASAFGVLYDHLGSRLLGYLQRQTRNRAVAEELVHDTFVKMHEARATFVRGAKVRPWAFAIARCLSIDAFRRRRHEVPLDGPEGGPSSGPLCDDLLDLVDPEASAVAHQLAGRLAAALGRLPASQREAFELVRWQGLSHADAAAILGCTVNAVKLRSFRALEALRAAAAAVDESANARRESAS